MGHGMEDETFEKMLAEMNEAASNAMHTPKKEAEPITEFKIEVTDFAAKKVLEIMKSNGKEGYFLEVGVSKGGCSGFTYAMDFEEAPASGDFVSEHNGLKFF